MAKKKGLGRGIDALMSSGDVPETRTGTEAGGAEFKERLDLPKGVKADKNGTLWIDPTLLKPNPHQPRREFVKEDLQELSDSIRENGVLQPILIEDANDGTFYIIAGERRTRASIIAGLKKVPVLLGKFNEVKKLEKAVLFVDEVSDKYDVTFSLGKSFYDAKEDLTIDEVIKMSDELMYKNKKKYKDGLRDRYTGDVL